MVLAFRTGDYRIMEAIASQLDRPLNEVILSACGAIGRNPNYYSNPTEPGDYEGIEVFDLEATASEFEQIVEKANDQNTSVEAFIVETLKMSAFLGIAPQIEAVYHERAVS